MGIVLPSGRVFCKGYDDDGVWWFSLGGRQERDLSSQYSESYNRVRR